MIARAPRVPYSKEIVKNGKYYWAKVTVAVSQSRNVEGWVCSKYCEGCWN